MWHISVLLFCRPESDGYLVVTLYDTNGDVDININARLSGVAFTVEPSDFKDVSLQLFLIAWWPCKMVAYVDVRCNSPCSQSAESERLRTINWRRNFL